MFLNSATRVKSQKPYWIDNYFQDFSMESNFQLLYAITRVSTMLAGESGTEFGPPSWLNEDERCLTSGPGHRIRAWVRSSSSSSSGGARNRDSWRVRIFVGVAKKGAKASGKGRGTFSWHQPIGSIIRFKSKKPRTHSPARLASNAIVQFFFVPKLPEKRQWQTLMDYFLCPTGLDWLIDWLIGEG